MCFAYVYLGCVPVHPIRLNCESDIRCQTHKHISTTPLWEVLLFVHLADSWCVCMCVRACMCVIGYLSFKPHNPVTDEMIELHATMQCTCVCVSQAPFTLSIDMLHTHTPPSLHPMLTLSLSTHGGCDVHPWPYAYS